MLSRAQLQQKFKLMPNRQAFVFQQQTTPGVFVSFAINDGWYRARNDKEKMASDGIYREYEKSILIPQAQYPTEPAQGDLIVDSLNGSVYTVLLVEDAGGQGVWKCKAVDLVLAANLRDAANLFTPTNTQDGIGARIPNYPAVPTYANVPCRVQEITGDRQELQGKIGFIRRYTCYLGNRVIVNTETQVVVNGITYQVRSYNDPDRIDQIMNLDLEIIP